jgi:predicted transcriptional regulator of viral defense system
MVYKNISSASNKILQMFLPVYRQTFHLHEVFDAFPHKNKESIRALLAGMVRRGLLMRLKEAHYFIIPFDQPAETFMPNWHSISADLVGNQPHYIGYFAALEIHGLITQPSMAQQIVVAKQVRPSKIYIKQIPFRFICHSPNHFFGFEKKWINEFQRVYCSSLEKTIIDCLFKPEYAGGIIEIAKAIFMAKEQIKFDQLLEFAKKFNSNAVIKRLGYLLDLLDLQTDILPELRRLKTNGFVVLDTELPAVGKRTTAWNIQQNVTPETIKASLFT